MAAGLKIPAATGHEWDMIIPDSNGSRLYLFKDDDLVFLFRSPSFVHLRQDLHLFEKKKLSYVFFFSPWTGATDALYSSHKIT